MCDRVRNAAENPPRAPHALVADDDQIRADSGGHSNDGLSRFSCRGMDLGIDVGLSRDRDQLVQQRIGRRKIVRLKKFGWQVRGQNRLRLVRRDDVQLRVEGVRELDGRLDGARTRLPSCLRRPAGSCTFILPPWAAGPPCFYRIVLAAPFS